MFLTYLPTLTLVPCPNNSAKQADSYLANNKWARTRKLCDIISRVQDRLDWPYYWHRSSTSCPFGCSAHAAEDTQLQVSKQSRKKDIIPSSLCSNNGSLYTCWPQEQCPHQQSPWSEPKQSAHPHPIPEGQAATRHYQTVRRTVKSKLHLLVNSSNIGTVWHL